MKLTYGKIKFFWENRIFFIQTAAARLACRFVKVDNNRTLQVSIACLPMELRINEKNSCDTSGRSC
jgi:hypothetical protein